MLEYLEVIRRTGSKYLGFVPDFGCFAVAPNKPQWDKALAAGVSEEHLKLAAQMRYDGTPIEQAQETLAKAGAHPAIMGVLQGMYGFVQFRPKDQLPALLDGLKAILPYSFEMHGKFHYLSEDCVERVFLMMNTRSRVRIRIITDILSANMKMSLAAAAQNLQSVCSRWKNVFLDNKSTRIK